MIALPFTLDDIRAAIAKRLGAAKSASWHDRASQLNREALTKNRLGKTTIWSDVKVALLDLQHGKCAYCESPVPWRPEEEFYGKGVTDIEHYRPKGRVQPWPTPSVLAKRAIKYQVKLGRRTGYPELAHDLLNFAVSCKICNSDLKGDRFPIHGKLVKRGTGVAKINVAERPCLLFPLGPHADDPDVFLAFDPLSVRAKGKGASHGRVTIDFFQLDDREDLIFGRAGMVYGLFPLLERTVAGTKASRIKSQKHVDLMCSDSAAFAAHARAFRDLHKTQRATARMLYEQSIQIVGTREPSLS